MNRFLLLCLLLPILISSQLLFPRENNEQRIESSELDDICARLPPSLWCTSQSLSKQCGYYDKCSQYLDHNRNKPILITLLYESLCPGCQKFIIEQLHPRVLKNFAPEFVQIELVPYGNAKIVNGTIVCQHGKDECSINKFESCLISALPDQNKHVPAIHCIEMQLKNRIDFDKAVSKCFRTLDIGMDIQTMIQSCLVTREGMNLQQKAAIRTDNVLPEKHDHVPWVLFNNASLGAAQNLLEDIPSLICEWWSGDKAIPYCEVEKAKANNYWDDRQCEKTLTFH